MHSSKCLRGITPAASICSRSAKIGRAKSLLNPRSTFQSRRSQGSTLKRERLQCHSYKPEESKSKVTVEEEIWEGGRKKKVPPKRPTDFGPQLPPDMGGPEKTFHDIPDWQQLLEEEALRDPEVAELLEGCEGDTKAIYEKIRQRFNARSTEIIQQRERQEMGMEVSFREFDSFNLWVWMEFYAYPQENERKLVEECVEAWFMLGHLGGFNCFNLQVSNAGSAISYLDYDNQQSLEDVSLSLFHNMDEVQFKGNWARFWVDMGTSDELAVDILINSLTQLSREYVGIKRMIVGGINEDWSEGTEEKNGGDLLLRMGKPGGMDF